MDNVSEIMKQIIDYLASELTPYELSMYLYLFRHSWLEKSLGEIRIGKRTIASGHAKSNRGTITSFKQVSDILKNLEKKGCIIVGDATREGTSYNVVLPANIPVVAKKLQPEPTKENEDYFTLPDKRREIFDRDNWTCQYCGDKLSDSNATIDHFIPQHKGGNNSKENLRACCFVCNSIKAGKTYEEASPFILENVRKRKPN